MEVHYVLYSDKLGVYLGGNHWSKADHAGIDSAPTFTRKEYDRYCTGLDTENFKAVSFPTHRLVEVWPDLPGFYASKLACVNAMLPRWP
jgi:hypothetical protein